MKIKNKKEGVFLSYYQLNDRVMIHNNLGKKGMTMNKKLTRGGIPRNPDCRCHVQEEEEKMIPVLLLFLRLGLLYAPTFC